jgi:hypothetical protein
MVAVFNVVIITVVAVWILAYSNRVEEAPEADFTRSELGKNRGVSFIQVLIKG